MPAIISRDEALERGLARYFTGKPCRRGHISERFANRVRAGNCVACTTLNSEKFRKAHARPPVQCVGCQRDFRPRNAGHRFCSDECRKRKRWEWADKKALERTAKKTQAPPPQCAVCHSDLKRKDRGASRFCSDKCRLKHSWRGWRRAPNLRPSPSSSSPRTAALTLSWWPVRGLCLGGIGCFGMYALRGRSILSRSQ
jgi:hypothetical protein